MIAALAGRQLGIVTRAQLLSAGVTRRKVQHRLKVGRLHPVHRGVYAVGHPDLAPEGRLLAAVLACGPGAVASHSSAAALWNLWPWHGSTVEITSEGTHREGPVGVRLHETSRLPPAEVRRRHGVPVTSPTRTLLDLAVSAGAVELERAVGEAQARGLVRVPEIVSMAQSGRRGSTALRAIMQEAPTLTRSEAERRLLALLSRAGLPRPQTNVRVGGHEVDAYWPARRLIVEVDGYAFHSSRAAFERDRIRDSDLQAAGLRVLRITWRQLTEAPEAVAARLGAALKDS